MGVEGPDDGGSRLAGFGEKFMSDLSMERRPPLFYGWFVVAAAFGVTFVGFGGAYSFSAFFESLQREFAASRGTASLAFTMVMLGFGSGGVLTGKITDPRVLELAGV